MSKENIEKAARVSVPKDLYDEFFERPYDAIQDYILKQNTEDLIGVLIAGGTLNTETDIAITFVPDEEAPKYSSVRRVKYMEVHRNPAGELVDVKVSERTINWKPDRKG